MMDYDAIFDEVVKTSREKASEWEVEERIAFDDGARALRQGGGKARTQTCLATPGRPDGEHEGARPP